MKDLRNAAGRCGFFFYCRNTLMILLMSLVTLSARPPQQIHMKVDDSNTLTFYFKHISQIHFKSVQRFTLKNRLKISRKTHKTHKVVSVH